MENFAMADHNFNVFTLLIEANIVVKLVVLCLLIASILCWAISFEKFSLFKKVSRNIDKFENLFWSGKSYEEIMSLSDQFPHSDVVLVFLYAMKEWEKAHHNPNNIQLRLDRAMEVALVKTSHKLEKNLNILATIASSAPFIGLFGTVIGIMAAFTSIGSSKNTSLAVVAPGIAEALLATAIGLLVAIPAAILYNKLVSQMNRILFRVDVFVGEFSIILGRRSTKID